MLGARSVVRPGVDEVVECGARARRGAHVTVPFEGVGGGDLAVAQPALDQLLHGVEGRRVGHVTRKVTDHTDRCQKKKKPS